MIKRLIDPITIELDHYLQHLYPRAGAGVVYEKIEETMEPEPGPSIYEIDLPEPLIKVLEKRGISRLYRYQYEAYKYILDGLNVVIVAGTGTGKTEAFFIPLAKKILTEERRYPLAMLIYPTKALARDQVKRFSEYSIYGKLGVGIYDGDTPEEVRKRIAANPPPVIVSNPDMLHIGLIHSPYIRRFVEQSEIMVFDELHVYEGVLGSHLHHLINRVKLTREKSLQFIASSATIGNPVELAESIFSDEFKLVSGPRTRRGKAVHILVSAGSLSRWSVAASIAKFLYDHGMKFIIFVDSQQLAELLASIIESRFNIGIGVHRAGLPFEVRRDIESKLRDGKIQGVVATPTLELGIDIGTLDAVVMVSPPPSYTKYLQRAGRAGRRRKGYTITILGEDPIDTFYLRNPEAFFNQELPPSIIEPSNEEVAKYHLVSYMLQKGKSRIDRLPLEWRRVVNDLVLERLLKKIGPYITVNYSLARAYVSERSGIRTQGDLIEIYDVASSSIIATRELPTAVTELYPGAIYFISKIPYEVIDLDLSTKRAVVRRVSFNSRYYTRPLYVVDIEDYDVVERRETSLGFEVAYIRALMKLCVHGYVIKDIYTAETKETVDLAREITYSYLTRAIAFKLFSPSEFSEHDSAEAFHAIEHALIEAARLTCGSGETDLGGISYPSGDIVIYDSAIGGSGISKILYSKLEKTIELAYEIMHKCTCTDGCPRCIYTPYCGNNNRVLSKRKAIYTLDHIFRARAIELIEPLEYRYGKPLV